MHSAETRRVVWTLLLCLLALPLGATPAWAQPITFHVAPGGNDSWSGRLAEPNPAGTDGPLASIDRAKLVNAGLGGADLHQARFEGADLRYADLRGANLFSAELLGATVQDARLELANVKGTKLA